MNCEPLASSSAASTSGSATGSTPAKSTSVLASVNARLPSRSRLPKGVYTIYTKFYRDVTQRPTRVQCAALLEEVRAAYPDDPIVAALDVSLVQRYFGRKRQTEREKMMRKLGGLALGRDENAGVLSAVGQTQFARSVAILHPTLAEPRVLGKLTVLLDDMPDPTTDMAEIWARKLGPGVEPAEILDFVRWRRLAVQKPAKNGTMEARTQHQLPTPELSPEPRRIATTELLTPVTPSDALPAWVTQEMLRASMVRTFGFVTEEEETPSDVKSEKEVEDEIEEDELEDEDDPAVPMDIALELADALRDALRPRTAVHGPPQSGNDAISDVPMEDADGPSETTPKTLDEWAAWLQPYTLAAKELLQKAEDGHYAHLGFRPTRTSGTTC